MTRLTTVTLLALLGLVPLPAQARRGGALIGIGGAVALPDESPWGIHSDYVALWQLQLGVPLSSRLDLVADLMGRINRVEDAGFTSFYHFYGLQLAVLSNHRMFIRTEMGFEVRTPYQPAHFSLGRDVAFAGLLAIGTEIPVGSKLGLVAEFFSVDSPGDSPMTFAGVAVKIVPVGARKRQN